MGYLVLNTLSTTQAQTTKSTYSITLVQSTVPPYTVTESASVTSTYSTSSSTTSSGTPTNGISTYVSTDYSYYNTISYYDPPVTRTGSILYGSLSDASTVYTTTSSNLESVTTTGNVYTVSKLSTVVNSDVFHFTTKSTNGSITTSSTSITFGPRVLLGPIVTRLLYSEVKQSTQTTTTTTNITITRSMSSSSTYVGKKLGYKVSSGFTASINSTRSSTYTSSSTLSTNSSSSTYRTTTFSAKNTTTTAWGYANSNYTTSSVSTWSTMMFSTTVSQSKYSANDMRPRPTGYVGPLHTTFSRSRSFYMNPQSVSESVTFSAFSASLIGNNPYGYGYTTIGNFGNTPRSVSWKWTMVYSPYSSSSFYTKAVGSYMDNVLEYACTSCSSQTTWSTTTRTYTKINSNTTINSVVNTTKTTYTNSSSSLSTKTTTRASDYSISTTSKVPQYIQLTTASNYSSNGINVNINGTLYYAKN